MNACAMYMQANAIATVSLQLLDVLQFLLFYLLFMKVIFHTPMFNSKKITKTFYKYPIPIKSKLVPRAVNQFIMHAFSHPPSLQGIS